LKYNINHEPST